MAFVVGWLEIGILVWISTLSFTYGRDSKYAVPFVWVLAGYLVVLSERESLLMMIKTVILWPIGIIVLANIIYDSITKRKTS